MLRALARPPPAAAGVARSSSRVPQKRCLQQLRTPSRAKPAKLGRELTVKLAASLSRDPLAEAIPPPTGPLFAVEKTVNNLLVESVVLLINSLYAEKPYARFFVLETIARVPYFAYTSVLHLYETLGWWRRADYLKVHFAETWNELHHLLIMESLGGDKEWADRFLAQHVAVAYYFMTCGIYFFSPRMAYNLMEQVELHAFETYDTFLKTHGEELKKMPPPEVAIQYYTSEANQYLFDEFQTGRTPGDRRPKIATLYDVFCNIRDDEAEHCVTMRVCQSNGALKSPHDPAGKVQEDPCEGVVECVSYAPSGRRWEVEPSQEARAAADPTGR